MSSVFADTSGWPNGFIPTEPFYGIAAPLIKRWRSAGTQMVTTNYVMAELAALLISPLRLPHAHRIAILTTIRTASWVEIVHIDSRLDARAWDLLRARPDKAWSLVDCTSFVLMQERGIQDALTTDQHFVQAGQTRLLQ